MNAADVFFALGVFGARREDAERLYERRADWNAAADLSFKLRTPLIYFRNLADFGLIDQIEENHRSRYEAWRSKALKSNFYWTHRFAEIVDFLRREGIRAVPLKGLSLVIGTYRDESLRASSDLDIWVSPADARPAAEAMRRRGWRIAAPAIRGVFVNHGQEFSAITPEDADIDVHFRLFSWYAERFVFDFNSADMFSRIVETEWNGAPLWRMRFEDEFLYLLMSFLGGGARSFRYVLDADALMRVHGQSWDLRALKGRLEAAQCAADCAGILSFMNDRLHTPGAVAIVPGATPRSTGLEGRIFAFYPEISPREARGLQFGLIQSIFDKITLIWLFIRWQLFKLFGWHRSYFLQHNNPEPSSWKTIE